MIDFSDESKATLNDIASKAMEAAKAPGASISLLRDGEIIYSRGYGSRNIEKNRPTTPDTLIGIGSCTKSFLCLSIMQLAEQGKLDVNDPVKDYLPLKLGYDDNPITIRNFMSHSSGISSLGTAEIMINRLSYEEGWIPLTGKDDFYSFVNVAESEVDAPPGERYYYLNSGFTMLGFIIEQVSGMSLEDYFRANIWKPLGMNRTTLMRGRFNGDSNVMTAYKKDAEGEVKESVHPFHELIYAPGGILSSTEELCSYLQMWLNNGEYEGKRLLSEDGVKEMTRPHTKRPDTVFGSNAYGYGWGIYDFLGYKMVIHTGSTGVSGAYLCYIPEKGVGVSYLTNIGNWGGSIPYAALALLLGEDPWDSIPHLKAQRHMDKLIGTYKPYRDIYTVDVERRENMLWAETKNRMGTTSSQLIPVSSDPEETEFNVYGGELGPTKVWFEEHPDETRLYWERRIFRRKKYG